jgi:4a-hydroxytetrahydrobiopterin dehydratase
VNDLPPGWTRTGETIEKTYDLGGFPAAIAFVERVAQEAEAVDHHPDIDIRYAKVRLALTTHSAGHLTDKDVDLARVIEERCAPAS